MNKQHSTTPRSPFVITVIGDRRPDLDLPPECREEAGSGWVRRLRHQLMLCCLDREVEVIDATETGNTLHRMRERWTDDVITRNPDVVLVHAGLSDAFGVATSNNPYAKGPAEAVAILEDLLCWTRGRCPDARIVLVEPFLNSLERSPLRLGPVGAALDGYVAALRELAAKHGFEMIRAGEFVYGAKRLRGDEWLGADACGMDTCGSMLLADLAARLVLSCKPVSVPDLSDGATMVVIGDSITDASRRENGSRPFGKGYFRIFQGLLAVRQPDARVNLVNKGIGGDTIIDIEERWQRDVMELNPGWVILYTGINDMNTVYGSRPVQIQPEDYGAGVRRCFDATRKKFPEARLLMVTPFFLSRDERADSYRNEILRRMPEYAGASERHLNGIAPVLHLQPVMEPLMRRFGNRLLGSNLGTDTVHPGELCQMAIAEALHAALSGR